MMKEHTPINHGTLRLNVSRPNRLRILVYGLNYAPELTGIGKYTGEMASWLAGRGHEVRVVTAPPYYPAWKIREDYRGVLYRTEKPTAPDQPTVFRTPLYVPAEASGIRRILHLASFMLGSIPVMLRQIFWKPDIVWTVEPTFFGAPLALIVSTAAGCPSWLHIQDFEVDAAFDLGLLPAHGPIHGLALALERIFTDAFTRVSSISTKMVERSIAKGIPLADTVCFPNWVDIDAIVPVPPGSVNSYRIELGLEAKTIILYSGNMGNKQGLELLAPLAQSFEDDASVHFLFCGDGTFRPQLEAQVAACPNVTILPLQPTEQLNELLSVADIHLLPQRANAADLVMPSKLTSMLSSGRPIVATAGRGTQVAHVVGGGGATGHDPCGLVVPAEAPAALHAAIQLLAESPDLRATLGAAARRYAVEHLGRDQVLARFERHLLALTRPSGPSAQVN